VKTKERFPVSLIGWRLKTEESMRRSASGPKVPSSKSSQLSMANAQGKVTTASRKFQESSSSNPGLGGCG